MRKNMLRASLIIIILSHFGLTHGQKAAEATSIKLDSLFNVWPDAGPGLAVGIVKDGEIAYEYFSGHSDRERDKSINGETTFWIASVSKQFTAMAITVLESRRKLNLDDPVSYYVPELDQFPTVTIKHLLHHTSGLRDGYTLVGMTLKGEKNYDPASVLRMLANQTELNFEPGSRFEYVNSNYVLLAIIIERVARKPFADFMKSDVFGPLGMQHARVYNHDPVSEDAIGYIRKNGRYRAVGHYLPAIGSSGVMMSMRDAIQLEKQFHQKERDIRVDRMVETATLNDHSESHYARGLEKYAIDSIIVFSHFGSDPGFRADILRIPQEQLSVIIFSNASDYWSLTRNLFDAAGIILQRSFSMRDESAQIYTSLSPFVGTYIDTVSGSSARFVKVKDGKLIVSSSLNGYYAGLIRVSEKRFLKDDYYETSYDFSEGSLLVDRVDGRKRFVKSDSSSFQKNNSRRKGRYYSAELGKHYRITYKKGYLRLSFMRIIHSRLYPVGESIFYSEFAGGNILSFVQERGKDILLFSRDGIKELRFERVK